MKTIFRKKNRQDNTVSRQNTITKYVTSDYPRFFKDKPIENLRICDITTKDINNNINDNVIKYNMKKKAFYNLKSVLNLVFKYAIDEEYITNNPMININNSNYKELLSKKVPLDQRYHDDDEVSRFIDYLNNLHVSEPDNIGAFALHFAILTGFRRGEIPPLMWSDVTKIDGQPCILVTKSQIRQEINKEDNIEHVKDFLKDSTKTDRDRVFYIYPELQDLLNRLREVDKKFYPNSEYLFPDDNTDVRVG